MQPLLKTHLLLMKGSIEAVVHAGEQMNGGPTRSRAEETMGGRGRRSMEHLAVGSVRENVVAHAPCPVFVVGEDRG